MSTSSPNRVETVIDTGLEYRPGDPVKVRIVHRPVHDGADAVLVSDDGGAVRRARRPDGWRAVADRLADELVINISRSGVVSLPVVRVGPGEAAIARRIAEASLALYQELLELD